MSIREYNKKVARLEEILEMMTKLQKETITAIRAKYPELGLMDIYEQNIEGYADFKEKINEVDTAAISKKAELKIALIEYTKFQTLPEVQEVVSNFKWNDIKSTIEKAYGQKFGTRKSFYALVEERNKSVRTKDCGWRF